MTTPARRRGRALLLLAGLFVAVGVPIGLRLLAPSVADRDADGAEVSDGNESAAARPRRAAAATLARTHAQAGAAAAAIRPEQLRRIHGSVRGADDGAPVAGARVALFGYVDPVVAEGVAAPRTPADARRSSATSAADGSFTLLVFSGAQEYDTLIAVAPGHRVLRMATDWSDPRAAAPELRLTAAPDARVVLRCDGHPLADGRATVSALSWGGGAFQFNLGTLDVAADGSIASSWFEVGEVYGVRVEWEDDPSRPARRVVVGWTGQEGIDLDDGTSFQDVMERFGHRPRR